MNEYVKTEWVDNDAPPLSAANLNHIENGIEAVTNAVIALHNAGVSPEQITATITEAVRSSLSNKMNKLGGGFADKIIISAADGSVRRSTYNVTDADNDFNGGATNKVPTASLVWRKTAQRATDLGRETDVGFVTPKDVYEIAEQLVFENLDTALQGNPNVSPSLYVMQDAQTGNYKLVYMDSDDNLHVLFDFGLLTAANGGK